MGGREGTLRRRESIGTDGRQLSCSATKIGQWFLDLTDAIPELHLLIILHV